MKTQKKFKYFILTFAILSMIIVTSYFIVGKNLPSDIKINDSNLGEIQLSTWLPITVRIKNDNDTVLASTNLNVPQNLNAELMLFNFLPIKTIPAMVIEKVSVVPCGTVFGIRLFTDGVMIVNISEIPTTSGVCCPAIECGLQKGDIIKKVANNVITDNEALTAILERNGAQPINIVYTRNSEEYETQLNPKKSIDDNKYRAGIWIRDSSLGIGTMSFYKGNTNKFSGLGHGICDIDTGEIMPLLHGDVFPATITSIKKGAKGSPGEIRGVFSSTSPIGTIINNKNTGIQGVLKEKPTIIKEVPLAMKHQVKIGSAEIISTVEGESPFTYKINIDNIRYSSNDNDKDMLITVTDENLIKKTGGIVQGMSGSPIIQNGMLVGAITHVFVNNPKKGYAIFAENML